MSRRILRLCNILLLVGWISSVVTPVAANDSLLTGSYTVQSQADSAGQVKVALQIRLQNHGARDLRIQRMTFWDFSHPAKGATQPSSIVLHAGNWASTTQEFSVPRAEYELWRRGSRPRLILETRTSNGQPGTVIVRLDHLSNGKARRP